MMGLLRLFSRAVRARGGRRFGWKSIVAACLVAGIGGTALLDWVCRPPVKLPPADKPNSARLMESMAAHAWRPDGEPIDLGAQVARRMKDGTPAPDFTLPSVEEERGPVSLSDFRGRPLVLVFGSFSCDVFNKHVGRLERLHRAYRDRAAFLFVNITEAGHQIPGLEFVLDDDRHDPLSDRAARIRRALKKVGLTMPAVVDTREATTEVAYDAFPLRLVCVSASGKISLDLGRGLPRPWDLRAAEEWLQSRPAGGAKSGDASQP